jgi:hypothetical protein
MPPVVRFNMPVVLYVTLTISPRLAVLNNTRFHSAWTDAIQDANAWRAFLYVIMPDHIHLFAVPRRLPRIGIDRWCEFLKSEPQFILALTLNGVGSPVVGIRKCAVACILKKRPPMCA